MPRQEFVLRFGQRYANLSYCQFKRTIRNETPHYVPTCAYGNTLRFVPDYRVNREEHRACQLGTWDCINIVI